MTETREEGFEADRYRVRLLAPADYDEGSEPGCYEILAYGNPCSLSVAAYRDGRDRERKRALEIVDAVDALWGDPSFSAFADAIRLALAEEDA